MKIIKVDFKKKKKVIYEEKPGYCAGACGIDFDFHSGRFLFDGKFYSGSFFLNGKYYCPGCFVREIKKVLGIKKSATSQDG